MEKMPFPRRCTRRCRPWNTRPRTTPPPPTGGSAAGASAGAVTLRELRVDDAASLCALLTTEEVARFISPPPTTVEGFERFIEWAAREQAAGRYACFAVVPAGTDTAVGIFQVRQLDAGFDTAEWGFVMGSAYWGTGLFVDGARLVVDFAFDDDRRAPPRSARRGGQRPRQRRARQGRRGAGRGAAPVVRARTASITTSTCGRFSPTTGARRARARGPQVH